MITIEKEFDIRHLEELFYQLCDKEPEENSIEEKNLIRVFCLLNFLKSI